MEICSLTSFAGRPPRVIVRGCDWVWIEYRVKLREWDVMARGAHRPWPECVLRTNDFLGAVGVMLRRVRRAQP